MDRTATAPMDWGQVDPGEASEAIAAWSHRPRPSLSRTSHQPGR
jgi:hypothetical protein